MILVACSPPASTVVEIAPLPQPIVTQQQPRPIEPQPLASCQAPEDSTGCTEMARLRVGRVEMSSPTCWVDAKVRAGELGRLLRCPSGAVAVFARASFAGPWGNAGGRRANSTPSLGSDLAGVDTCLRTEFPFRDGCTWETMQRVRGGPSVLEFTYAERPIRGDSCAPNVCTARADIEVEQP